VRTLTVALLLTGLVLSGCGGDDGKDEDRAQLVDSLGFLDTDLGLTEDEVACTARTIEEELGDDDLDELAAQVRRVDEGEVALADLPEDVSTTLTDSIASCAGSS